MYLASPEMLAGGNPRVVEAEPQHSLESREELIRSLYHASSALVKALGLRYGKLSPLDISLLPTASLTTRYEDISGTRLSLNAYCDASDSPYSHQYMVRNSGGIIDPVKPNLRTLDQSMSCYELQDRVSAIVIAGAMLDL